jgi:hypothetical protein
MFTVFLLRESPDSTDAKPRCMMNTNAEQIIIQMLFATNSA